MPLAKQKIWGRDEWNEGKSKNVFFQEPYKYVRNIFDQSKSALLKTEKKVLEKHLKDTYSDPNRHTPLEHDDNLIRQPIQIWGSTFEDIRCIVNKNRNKSTPGPNGILIIIMSCRSHRYPWPSLATSPYRSWPLVGLQGHIPSPHIAAGCMFDLVVLFLSGHMWGSIGVHHLWARHLPPITKTIQVRRTRHAGLIEYFSFYIKKCPKVLNRLHGKTFNPTICDEREQNSQNEFSFALSVVDRGKVFVERPTYARVWHKAFFDVGTRRKAVAQTRRTAPKISWASSAFP